MGFFSNLFKKKENAKPVINLNPTVKTCHTPSAPEIPPYQGDYAKTVFLWAHDKAAPIKSNDSYARYFMYECGINNLSSDLALPECASGGYCRHTR